MDYNKLTKSLIFSLLPLLILLSLGTWQLERLRWKTEIINSINSQIALPAIEINESIINNIQDYNYRYIKLNGKFLYDKQITIYSKVFEGKVGRHLVVPFKTEFGNFIINRGFVPENYIINKNKENIDNNISITGIVKFQQKINYFTPKNNLLKNDWYYINIDNLKRYLGITLNNFYIIEDNNEKERFPVGGQFNINIPNDHLQYSITWFSLAIALSIFMHLLWKKNVA